MTVRIGVEEEFHVLDLESGSLVPRAGALLGRLHRPGFTTELHQTVVEWNSEVHASLHDLHADIVRSRRSLDGAASSLGLAAVAAGTAPLARLMPHAYTSDLRYRRMAEEYGRVADEQLVCSAQVHVDVPDRDTAVRVMCAIRPWLPPLLALSASSPFWLGDDTGYASWRTMVWQRWPTAGPVGCFTGAAEYDAVVEELIGTEVISDAGMVYFDLRPSAHQRTLELRVCDACPRPETVVLVAGLYRALVVDACERLAGRGAAPCESGHEWVRAATWRAARSGLEGALLDPRTRRPAPAPVVLRGMLARLRPALEAAGDWPLVRDLTEQAIAEGSAAHRIRRTARERGLPAAVDQLIARTRSGRPPRRRAGSAGGGVVAVPLAPPAPGVPGPVRAVGG
ncbi:glutamate--cysteine ligase [Streptomyces capparidis]